MHTTTRKEGFTLLEVMIAMAILAMSLTILLGSVNSGVVYGGNARDTTIAAFLAQEKMTELERKRDLLANNTSESGRFEDEFERFSWEYTVRTDLSAKQLVESVGTQIPFDPMKVEVTVKWKDGQKERSFVLQEMIFPAVVTTSTVTTQPGGATTPPTEAPPFGLVPTMPPGQKK